MMRTNTPLDRRQFLQASVAAAAGSFAYSRCAASSEAIPLIDTHVYVGRWPLRRLSVETPAELVEFLRRENVSQAWAGTFEGLFHKDIHSANLRLARVCNEVGNGMLVAVGTANPTLPDWEEDVRRCDEAFKMPGIRLHPTYHGYALDDPRFVKMLQLAAARGLFVQVVVKVTDDRRRYLTPRESEVDISPLVKIMPSVRDLQLVVAGAAPETALALKPMPNGAKLWFDFARVKDSDALRRMVDRFSAGRIVYGSSGPLTDIGASRDVLQRANFGSAELNAIRVENAKRIGARGV